VDVSGGSPAERLVCHPRLPLVAGLDAERPAVRIWSCQTGQLRELGCVGAQSDGYGDAVGWERIQRTPAAAWHPHEPRLVVAGDQHGLVQWTPSGLSAVDAIPPTADYRSVAFSPDGRTLWASPSSDQGWDTSDAVDLASGTVTSGPPWDTGVAHHPGGGLIATLNSDQGATHGLFARIDPGAVPGTMRLLRRALILDVDDYETPLFSADGRHLAIRGNAYDNTLEVFAFPSLQRVLATTLGEPDPGGCPRPQKWLDQMRSWSRHNLAFTARPAVLWVGTPTGTLVEIDVETPHAIEHDILAGSPVSALAATASGELVLAGGGAELVLVTVRSHPEETRTTDDADVSTAASAVSAFLDSTSDVPDSGELEDHLVLTDGDRVWNPDDLTTVHNATEQDPTWLQLRAAINQTFDA
jgi:WD40 repeat protein